MIKNTKNDKDNKYNNKNGNKNDNSNGSSNSSNDILYKIKEKFDKIMKNIAKKGCGKCGKCKYQT